MRHPHLHLLAAALLFSTAGAAIKASTLTSWQIASFRSAVATVTMLALVPAARQAWTRRTLLVGATYGATMVMFVQANKLTTAANAVFLQATAPLYLILLAPWLLGERITRRDLTFTAAIGAGLALILTDAAEPTAIAPHPVLGNAVGALSGASWALTVIGLRWIGRAERGGADRLMPAIVTGNIVACLIGLGGALPVERARPLDWALVAYLGVFQITLAYVCLTRAMPRVPAFEASLLLLAEIALNPVWVWLVHREAPGRFAVGGATLVLAATLAKAWIDAPRGPATIVTDRALPTD